MEQNKNAAIVAYLTIIGAVIAIFMNSENKSAFASFHIRQAMGIFLIFFVPRYFFTIETLRVIKQRILSTFHQTETDQDSKIFLFYLEDF